ncbi:MAG: hypothetical protein JKY87_00210 [Mariprofundus sp.]|nr:hypothetical protein [Mariprofundus sp.]
MDKINALFEFCGFLAVLPSIVAAHKSKQIVGVSLVTPLFFAAWGYWNILFYPHLDQVWSAYAAVLLAVANSYWLVLVWKYKSE